MDSYYLHLQEGYMYYIVFANQDGEEYVSVLRHRSREAANRVAKRELREDPEHTTYTIITEEEYLAHYATS